jgi:hypothetical protein
MLSGKKTYLVVVGGLLVVAGGFLQGQLDLAEAINQGVLLLGLGGLRAGVAGK